MKIAAFTDRGVKALKPKAKRYVVHEKSGDGLGLRVSPSGTKTWYFAYHFAGRRPRITYGTFPDLSVKEARSAHFEARRRLARGEDPARRRRPSTAAEPPKTLAQVGREFLEDRLARGRAERTVSEYSRQLKRDVFPILGNRPVAEITPADIQSLVKGIQRRGAPVMANRVLATLSAVFSYARPAYLTLNPCDGVEAPSTERPRERVLSPHEIQVFWRGLDSGRLGRLTRIALRLILVTAQRPGEVVWARWDDIDLAEGWWTMPSSSVKNRQLHRVWLSGLARDLFREARAATRKSGWVLPSPRKKKDKPIHPTSLNTALVRSREAFGDLEPFTPHDLRRTAASQLAALGTPRDVLKRILNHSDSDVTAIYDRYSYAAERREALERWAKSMAEIVG